MLNNKCYSSYFLLNSFFHHNIDRVFHCVGCLQRGRGIVLSSKSGNLCYSSSINSEPTAPASFQRFSQYSEYYECSVRNLEMRNLSQLLKIETPGVRLRRTPPPPEGPELFFFLGIYWPFLSQLVPMPMLACLLVLLNCSPLNIYQGIIGLCFI